MEVKVVGAGLAGCECAWQLANRGIDVELIEMKPGKKTPAHVSDDFGELVCSNSLRSDELTNAVGLLKEEMRRCGGLIIACADATRVPAGGALAVDRVAFAKRITDQIRGHPRITVRSGEVTEIPEGTVVIATGPLTSEALSEKLREISPDDEFLSFYDAAAPIVTYESVDMENAYFASRYGKGTADYINCPMTEQEYKDFRRELCAAQEAEMHGFDDGGVFEGCMPIEVMARRGEDTMRYGPMKPVGLEDPRTGKEPYAVVQLRKDNAQGTIYNIVGFQTHLKFPEQKRVFSMIPALKNAEFVRYGVMHRTPTSIPLSCWTGTTDCARIPGALCRTDDGGGGLRGVRGLRHAGGHRDGPGAAGTGPADFPRTTATGALALYISEGSVGNFQPMNINFGIIEPLGYRVKGKRNKNAEISRRALEWIDGLRRDGIV